MWLRETKGRLGKMSMTEWAENEVRLACKKENPDWDGESFDYGCACYQSALKAYKSLCEDGHSGMSFGFTKNILIRLMNEKPLTPIEDIPESWILVCVDDDGTKKYQCNRMHSLFKYISPDGTINYSDINSYYCKDLITGLTYHGGGAIDILSKYVKPVTFPYYPPDKKYVLYTAEWLTDRKNGDFDTKAYLSIDTPEGENITVNEFWGEINGNWQQISKSEYTVRVLMHQVRKKHENEVKQDGDHKAM